MYEERHPSTERISETRCWAQEEHTRARIPSFPSVLSLVVPGIPFGNMDRRQALAGRSKSIGERVWPCRKLWQLATSTEWSISLRQGYVISRHLPLHRLRSVTYVRDKHLLQFQLPPWFRSLPPLFCPNADGGLKRDNSGRAYIIDAQSGDNLLADSPQAGESALSALRTNPAPTFGSFSAPSTFPPTVQTAEANSVGRCVGSTAF